MFLQLPLVCVTSIYSSDLHIQNRNPISTLPASCSKTLRPAVPDVGAKLHGLAHFGWRWNGWSTNNNLTVQETRGGRSFS